MDGFTSIVLHVPCEDDHTLDLNAAFVTDEMLSFYDDTPDFEGGFDIGGWGWLDGGLATILRLQAKRMSPGAMRMFFRGAALFENFDDAKNDYLMNPMVESYTAQQVTVEQHVPFGMVIPVWATDHRRDIMAPDRTYVASVTIILFWQDI